MKRFKWSLRLFSVVAVFMLASTAPAWAVSYVAGDLVSGGIGLVETYYNGSLAVYFRSMDVSGPAGDSLVGKVQTIGGIYTFTNTGGGIYTLTQATDASAIENYGTNGLAVKNVSGSSTYLTAQASALEINLNTHQIKWDLSNLSVVNAGTSAVLAEMASAPSYYTTSLTFSFETLGTENTWLTGSAGSYNARALTELAVVPEPEEWALMILGLALLGYYMNRKGWLKLGQVPQAYA